MPGSADLAVLIDVVVAIFAAAMPAFVALGTASIKTFVKAIRGARWGVVADVSGVEWKGCGSMGDCVGLGMRVKGRSIV